MNRFEILGFDTARLMSMRFELLGDEYRQGAARLQKVEEIVKRVEAISGVTSATASALIPVSGGGTGGNIIVEGRQSEKGREPTID